MKNQITLLLGFLLLATFSFGQAVNLKTSASSSVSVGRARIIEESPVHYNPVLIQAWHAVGQQGCTAAEASTFYIDGNSIAGDHSSDKGVLGYGCAFKRELTHNLRTNAGADAQATQMGNVGSQQAACGWIALSADTTAPAAADTTVAGEITTNGLSRHSSTYAHTNGTATFTEANTFTDTTAQTANVQKTGLLNASSNGTLCFESTFTPVTLNVNDTLAVTWTINY